MEVAAELGFGGVLNTVSTANSNVGNANAGSGPMKNINPFLLQNLQALIAANPAYLTGGIPTQLLSQLMDQSKSAPNYVMQQQSPRQIPLAPEEEEGEEEEMGVAETYADYWPAKLKLGRKHPDAVVETASLSSVEPADISYKLDLPNDTINGGLLSALQLESITYASQAHEQLLPDGSRAGFLIGDGAGVGKGRTIAGIIFENYLRGRKKSIWISVSNDLKYDAERDLRDIGAGKIEVHPLNKVSLVMI